LQARLAKIEIIESTLAGNHHPTDNERKAMVCWHNANAILREIDRREKLSALPEMIVEEIDEFEQPSKLKRAKKIEVEEPSIKRQKVKNNKAATKKRKIGWID
jgi:hypothetical protein